MHFLTGLELTEEGQMQPTGLNIILGNKKYSNREQSLTQAALRLERIQ